MKGETAGFVYCLSRRVKHCKSTSFQQTSDRNRWKTHENIFHFYPFNMPINGK